MKKFLFTSLFAACAAMGLSSCMNGDYDATPNANNGNPNPLATGGGNGGGGGGGGSASGQISFKLNGTQITYNNASYVASIGRQISGGTVDGGLTKTLSIFLASYNGAGTYNLTDPTLSANYTEVPTGTTNANVWNASSMGGSGTVVVTSDANNTMVGTFNFVGVLTFGSGASQMNITEGTFNVPKQ